MGYGRDKGGVSGWVWGVRVGSVNGLWGIRDGQWMGYGGDKGGVSG